MPIFEFTCLECGNEFEKIVKNSSENGELQCPECNSSRLEEKVSCFASVSSNGSSGASNCTPSEG